METTALTTYDSDTPPERWAPVGAVADSQSSTPIEYINGNNGSVDALLDENDKMANSLLSLTSHFAQVQFRLKQIIEGPDESKEERLKELEQFAEKGIPDIKSCVVPEGTDSQANASDVEYKKKLSVKQKEMIAELKSSLSDLESYAYENGLAEELPTSKKLEKQDVIIEEIKRKLQISNLDNLASLSSSELRECVDEAVSQIVNPAKVKEQQVEQLQTQVVDLERFVDFLQAEVTNAQKEAQSKASSIPKSGSARNGSNRLPSRLELPTETVRTQGTGSSVKSEDQEEESFTSRMKRVIGVVNMYILSELGCRSRASDSTRKEMKYKNTHRLHYGDMLAEMQMAVDKLADTAEKVAREKETHTFTDCDYLSDEETYISESRELTQCVRKHFAVTLKRLIEHGVSEFKSSQALMAFAARSPSTSIASFTPNEIHAWKIILKYYQLKDGQAFNETPHRKLANSFAIESMGNAESTVKQTLLTAIGQIIETHNQYKRSDDAHFKAFICLALNEKKLVPWLRQIFRTSALVDEYYERWSYLVKTGFEDVFCAMNKLKLYDFNLPVDLAVQQFSNIKDAF